MGVIMFSELSPLRPWSGLGQECMSATVGNPARKCPPNFLGSSVLFQGLAAVLSEKRATFWKACILLCVSQVLYWAKSLMAANWKDEEIKAQKIQFIQDQSWLVVMRSRFEMPCVLGVIQILVFPSFKKPFQAVYIVLWRLAGYAPQIIPLWHKDYFELIVFEKQQTLEKLWKPKFLFCIWNLHL